MLGVGGELLFQRRQFCEWRIGIDRTVALARRGAGGVLPVRGAAIAATFVAITLVTAAIVAATLVATTFVSATTKFPLFLVSALISALSLTPSFPLLPVPPLASQPFPRRT